MGYTALYRKFRPHTFEDVKGQDHIVTTLKNQIKANRVGHAYLFCGTRGTGKTTIAKIFAKAVNCLHPVNGSPCNECEMCKSISAGTSMNVIEIDAASNNGVDNIREINDEVSYSPTEGKFKVYIIDEVHMLSIGAFNALLKTLEEPPAYVIFVLATTEAHKIPITILSRCQRYDFKRISIETISDRLMELMEEEKVEVEERGIKYIAKKADGSMRDALSLLDQCIAFYLGETLTYEHVLEVLGAVEVEVFSALLNEIISKNLVGAIHRLEDLVMQGRELGQFVLDFTWHMRNLLLVKTSDNIEDVLDVSSDNLRLLKEDASHIEAHTLMRFIRIFSELSNQIKYASQKRILIEIALIKLCQPSMENQEDTILDRIKAIEEQLEKGVVVSQETAVHNKATDFGNRVQKVEEEEVNVHYDKAAPEDLKEVMAHWKSIISEANPRLKVVLSSAQVRYNAKDEKDNRLFVVFHDFLGEPYTKEPEGKEELERIIAKKIGKQVEVNMILSNDQTAQDGRLVKINVDDVIRNQIHMDVEVVDDEEEL
ncbi:MAG TPA: DNA polymerase III subunit gamma/tau [Candidatus Merdenecus merdavium]|nr:DNA polymerase III subunit gamma/tau [Candidatus Merdenecus merdavium]